MTAQLSIAIERWPLREPFVIARGAVTEVTTVVATLEMDGLRGRGECRPYPRYDETPEQTVADIEKAWDQLGQRPDRARLQTLLKAGAARNALDCAMWDLEAKRRGTAVHVLAGLAAPQPIVTAYTLSLGAPEAMEAAARAAADRPLLKVKLGAPGDEARIAAVRRGAPQAEIILDANEGWSEDVLAANLEAAAAAGVTLVEQPLPQGRDEPLAGLRGIVPVCADESVHDRAGLEALLDRYDLINIKLDKTGGLTEALALRAAAERAGLGVMVGCMVASSLAMAPAVLLAQGARIADLDGPLLLARDVEPPLAYNLSTLEPPDPALWG